MESANGSLRGRSPQQPTEAETDVGRELILSFEKEIPSVQVLEL
jgi:hypothetical protein